MGMGSEIALSLPIVKFSMEDMIPITANWISVRNKTCKALEDYGCFEAVYDGVPLELHYAMLDALDELFELPLETKMKNTSDKPYHGYMGATSLIPIHEGFGIDSAPARERVQDFTKLMWPEGNDSFCVLRVLRYRGPQVNENKLGMLSHTDKSFITILHQNLVKGLEIKTRNGEWITFTPSENSFAVIAGDAFLAWSNGRIHSAHHRVVIDGVDARYSMGLFTHGTELIKCPDELVDEEHPLMFKPYYTKDLFNFYVTDEGQKVESTVKSYCGV